MIVIDHIIRFGGDISDIKAFQLQHESVGWCGDGNVDEGFTLDSMACKIDVPQTYFIMGHVEVLTCSLGSGKINQGENAQNSNEQTFHIFKLLILN